MIYSGMVAVVHFLLVLYYLGYTSETEELAAKLEELKWEKIAFFFILLPVYVKALGIL